MAYELASLKMPFPAKTVNELYIKINKGKYNRIPSSYSDGLSQLITDMLNPDPMKRPTSESIVACSGTNGRNLVLNKFDMSSLAIKPTHRKKAIDRSVFEKLLDPEVSNLDMFKKV